MNEYKNNTQEMNKPQRSYKSIFEVMSLFALFIVLVYAVVAELKTRNFCGLYEVGSSEHKACIKGLY